MGLEIERKFRVRGEGWRDAPAVLFRQGYLSRDPARTVRVRIAGDQAFLTIKGKGTGIARAEFEYPLPLADADTLLALCDGPLIEKTRRCITHDGLVWEVDEFLGENAGLIVAELELTSVDQPFSKPDWVGEEVSDDPRYFNAQLSVHPYSRWGDTDEERLLERTGSVGVG